MTDGHCLATPASVPTKLPHSQSLLQCWVPVSLHSPHETPVCPTRGHPDQPYKSGPSVAWSQKPLALASSSLAMRPGQVT